jgi:ketosteroid isomerase-like protein
MMNKILPTFALLLFTFPLCAQPGGSTNTPEHEVQQTIIQLFDALTQRDAVRIKNYCTTDVRFYEYGQTWTLDTLINKAITKNTAPDFKRTNKLDFVNTTLQGDAAWATYNLYSEVTREGKSTSLHWLETVVLVKDEKIWRVKVLHSSLIKKS